MRHRNRLSVAAALGVTIAIAVGSGQPATEGSEILIDRNFSLKPIPQWKSGYFLGYERDPVSSPPVFAYDRSGQKLFETPLALDGAQEVYVKSMAVSRDGLFAFSGLAVNWSGARVPFLAFLDQAGRLVRVNRPEGFFPRHLCFTEDGTLWAAGLDPREVDHAVLRGYSPDGKLKFSLLPKSSFRAASADRALDTDPAADSNTISQLATNNKIVVFLTAGFRELIGIYPDGQVGFRKPMDKPSGCDFINGFAVAPDGRFLISCEERGDSAGGGAGFSFHQFDVGNGSWVRLYGRSVGQTGLPQSIGFIEGDQMLITLAPGRFRWMSRLP